MRGKAPTVTVVSPESRITPAYAGKRLMQIFQMAIFGDHPRLCGEKLNGKNGSECVIGSPPPMRGKGDVCVDSTDNSRITPAYAGKRKRRLTTTAADGDHPRLCGEKYSPSSGSRRSLGSPPPMRGKEYAHTPHL